MQPKSLWPAASLLALVVLCASASGVFAQPRPNDAPDAQVPTIVPAALVRMISEIKLLVFDVRSLQEYAVSHLKGAKRIAVDAESDRARFLIRMSRLEGATVVFYCTTAQRSGDFAQGVMHELVERGAKDVFVLKGGIIAWHNEGRLLVDRKGTTRHVHPFNEDMKQYLRRPELARLPTK